MKTPLENSMLIDEREKMRKWVNSSRDFYRVYNKCDSFTKMDDCLKKDNLVSFIDDQPT